MNREISQGIIAFTLFLLLVVLVVFGPIFTIWSLNNIFNLEIPCNFKSWCAVIWLTTVLHGIKITFKKND